MIITLKYEKKRAKNENKNKKQTNKQTVAWEEKVLVNNHHILTQIFDKEIYKLIILEIGHQGRYKLIP